MKHEADTVSSSKLAKLLNAYRPRTDAEAADVTRVRELVIDGDPWRRELPLHVTASALIVHPARQQVLLRWHVRMQAWLQVGGHGDPGESDPLAVALREGQEETGLPDLSPWPDAGLLHVVVVSVPAGGSEPAHEHADLRFVLSTERPEAAVPENPASPLRWLTVTEAIEATAEDNLRESLARLRDLWA